MAKEMQILDRKIGEEHPCYIIAEVSCNHEGNFEEAKKIIEAAAQAGVDAVKLQTYTADTITRDFKNKPKGTMWEDSDLHGLYQKAHTPWDWHTKLDDVAKENGLHLFSSPFDETAVDFLVSVNCPVLKVASFEVVDTKLLEKMAKTGLPIIMSNGMTDYLEMDEAIRTLYKHGTKDLALLHCNSGYPASFDEVNLKTMQAMKNLFNVPVGLSDHTIYANDKDCTDAVAHVTPVEAVKMGAKIIEVHLTLDREHARELHSKDEGGYDWAFSMNPDELTKMVQMIREFEKNGSVEYTTDLEKESANRTHGEVRFEPTEKELNSRKVRPTLWVVEDVKKGEAFKFAGGNKGNVDSIRPGGGLPIRFADLVDTKVASVDIPAGTPLSWNHVSL